MSADEKIAALEGEVLALTFMMIECFSSSMRQAKNPAARLKEFREKTIKQIEKTDPHISSRSVSAFRFAATNLLKDVGDELGI